MKLVSVQATGRKVIFNWQPTVYCINLLISSNSLLAAPVLGRPQELPQLHQHQRDQLRDLLSHKSDFYQVRSFLADMICEYPQTIEVPEKSTLTFTLFALLSVSE